MRIIKPGYEILTPVSEEEELKRIELAARTCYKSEDKITKDSADKMVRSLIKRGHEAMIEHGSMTVKFIVDRGVSHEIVRHRVASYAQESTRYCNYANDKFGNEITVIEPLFFVNRPEMCEIWMKSCLESEKRYFELLELGATPQEARSVLPNSLKTEIVVTMNWREWRHFFRLRASKAAHPQMREVAYALLEEMVKRIPALFEDVVENLT